MAATDKATISVLCSGPGSIPLFSKMAFFIAALTAGNIAASTAAVTALANRMQALVTGTVSKSSIAVEAAISSAYPSVPANRGQKWIVSSTNPSGRTFTHTVPAADPDGGVNGPNTLSDGITANFAATSWTNFIGAFNAIVTDPDGAALTITRAKLGGRRA